MSADMLTASEYTLTSVYDVKEWFDGVDALANGSLVEDGATCSHDGEKKFHVPKLLSTKFSYITKLNLQGCGLDTIPKPVGLLSGLQTLNLMLNNLTDLPESIGNLSNLTLLGLKGNRLRELPQAIKGLTKLRELYLTDNKLEFLPDGFSQLVALVKLQASFNKFREIPWVLVHLPNLEMMRLACCEIGAVPQDILARRGAFPKLAWVSLAGNPCCKLPDFRNTIHQVPVLSRSQIQVGDCLGSGASGEVFVADVDSAARHLLRGGSGRAHGGTHPAEPEAETPSPGRPALAVKFFVSSQDGTGIGISPDGRLEDEVAITCALDHLNLQRVLAAVSNSPAEGSAGKATGSEEAAAASADIAGLVFKRFDGVPLAAKPSSAHLLRCRWAPERVFARALQPIRIAERLAGALAACHGDGGLGLCHGDIYAHNVLAEEPLLPNTPLMDPEGGDESGSRADDLAQILLCDFGAAFPYPQHLGDDAGSESPPGSSPDGPTTIQESVSPSFPSGPPVEADSASAPEAEEGRQPAALLRRADPNLFWQTVEVRAFGLLLRDMVDRLPPSYDAVRRDDEDVVDVLNGRLEITKEGQAAAATKEQEPATAAAPAAADDDGQENGDSGGGSSVVGRDASSLNKMHGRECTRQVYGELRGLVRQCLSKDVLERPLFGEIQRRLGVLRALLLRSSGVVHDLLTVN